ncbi:hypothetical protein CWB41_13460 [Methylovirgula ligni]|nr:hypothetical protein CWB41_13460 [Methylovirgula ligni]
MFAVKWVTHRRETQPVEMENIALEDLDMVVSSCLERLPALKRKHPLTPPDGFLIFDGAGNEVRRWFESTRPHVRGA